MDIPISLLLIFIDLVYCKLQRRTKVWSDINVLGMFSDSTEDQNNDCKTIDNNQFRHVLPCHVEKFIFTIYGVSK